MSQESEEFVTAFRSGMSSVRDRIIERASYVSDLASLGKACEDMLMPGHAAAVYRFLADEYGANASAALARLAVEADADFYEELRDLVGKRELPTAKGAPLSSEQLTVLQGMVREAMVATYATLDGEKKGAALYLQVALTLRDWGRPEPGLAFARRAAFLSPRHPDARSLCADLRGHRTGLSEALYLQFRYLPPMEALRACLERKTRQAKKVEPFAKLSARLSGSAPKLEARFGAVAPGDQEVVEQVNQFRQMFATEVAPGLDLKPPSLLRGHMTNWGWFSERESAAEHDWDERLEAWELANQLADQAREGGLVRGGESDCSYGAFVTLAPKSTSLKDYKLRLGLEADELLETDALGEHHNLEGAECVAYLLFFGHDALQEGVDAYFSAGEQETARRVAATMHQRLRDVRRLRLDISEEGDGRYVCSPEYCLGWTPSGRYLVGLWAYETRS